MKRELKVNEVLRLELKYCERCGGLWLRPAGGTQVYCASCARQMSELPRPWRRLDGSVVRGEDDCENFAVEPLAQEDAFGEFAGGEL
jgi:Zn-finger nucleic acid-binding protein